MATFATLLPLFPTLTPLTALGLGAAACGALGTLLLYFGTFGLQPLLGNYNVPSKDDRRIDARNRRRRKLQRAGLLFLLTSFLLAGIKELLG